MDLVDHENDVAERFHFVDKAFHAALKLPAELCSGDKRRQIDEMHLLVTELIRNIARRNALRERLGNRRFSDARLADKTRIVLLAARQNLHDARGFPLPADDGVKLSLARRRGQVAAVIAEKFPVFLLLFGGFVVLFLIFFPFIAAFLHTRHRTDREIAENLGKVERRRAAFMLILGILALRPAGSEQSLEIVFHIFKIVIRNSHIGKNGIHLRDSKLFGAFQAKPLVLGFVILDLRNKQNRHSLMAS